MASTLGDRIRLIRKTNRLSQTDFSNLIGISQGTLSELEQDKYNPSLETILAIHKVLKPDISWLLLGDKEENAPTVLFHTSLEEKELRLIELFRKLFEDDQDEILQFMDLKLKRY